MDEIRDDVAKRLAHVCEGWSSEDFEEVVNKVTAVAIKYADTPVAAAPAVEPGPKPAAPREPRNR